MNVRGRATLTAFGALTAVLVLAAPAVAATQDGEGLVGETDDKIVTLVSLGLVVFFALFVILATLVQSRLERRKDAIKAARMRQRIGW